MAGLGSCDEFSQTKRGGAAAAEPPCLAQGAAPGHTSGCWAFPASGFLLQTDVVLGPSCVLPAHPASLQHPWPLLVRHPERGVCGRLQHSWLPEVWGLVPHVQNEFILLQQPVFPPSHTGFVWLGSTSTEDAGVGEQGKGKKKPLCGCGQAWPGTES